MNGYANAWATSCPPYLAPFAAAGLQEAAGSGVNSAFKYFANNPENKK